MRSISFVVNARPVKAGRPHHCENRTALGIAGHDGVFADYFTLPIKNLHIVPERVPDEAAVFTEPLAAALEIQEQVQIQPGMRVLVVGAGRLGLLIAQTLQLTGCDQQVVVRRDEPARLLADWGISSIYPENVLKNGYDLVVEVTVHQGGSSFHGKLFARGNAGIKKHLRWGCLPKSVSALWWTR